MSIYDIEWSFWNAANDHEEVTYASTSCVVEWAYVTYQIEGPDFTLTREELVAALENDVPACLDTPTCMWLDWSGTAEESPE